MKKIIMLAAMTTSVATLLCSCSLRGGKLRAELPCDPCPDCLMIDNCDISFGDGNMYFYAGDIVNNTSMINIANSEGKQTLIAEYDLSENEGLQNVLVSDGKIYALIFNDMSGRYYIGTVDEENRTVTPVVEPGADMKEWNVRSGKIVYVISVFRDDNMERRNVFVYDIESGETENVCTEVCSLTGEDGKLWFVDEQDDGYVIGSYDIESGIIETGADFKLDSVTHFYGVSANYCVYTALVDGEDEKALYYYDVAKGTSTLICGHECSEISMSYAFCGDKFYYGYHHQEDFNESLIIYDLASGEETVGKKLGYIISNLAIREDGGAYVEILSETVETRIYSVDPDGTSRLIYWYIRL